MTKINDMERPNIETPHFVYGYKIDGLARFGIGSQGFVWVKPDASNPPNLTGEEIAAEIQAARQEDTPKNPGQSRYGWLRALAPSPAGRGS